MSLPFGNPNDDEPKWREWLADLRDAPPWRMERPGWLRESPTALLVALAGIACVVLSVAYVAVPPQSLPAALPGHWELSGAWKAKAENPPTTTTTTVLTKEAARRTYAAGYKLAATLSPDDQRKFWEWVAKSAEVDRQRAADEALANSPPTPPFRRWDLAFVTVLLAAALLAGAWYFSETRFARGG
jgi:hypothetical protein